MNDEATKELIRQKAAEAGSRIKVRAEEIRHRNMELLVEMARRGEALPPLSAELAIEVFERATAIDGDEPEEDEREERASPKP